MSASRYRQRIVVPFEFDVAFTRDLFASDNETLAQTLPPNEGPARLAVFVEEGILNRWQGLSDKIVAWCAARPNIVNLLQRPISTPGGEECKNNLVFSQRMSHQLQRLQLCRHSYVMAIGGGAMLNAVGLSAAVFHRGVRLIRVPTTVLSQDDSGVGVKNAINLDGVKNLIGTFAPPFAVLNDALFLTTLEQRDWVSGLSEAFKVAIIKDVPLLEELEARAEAVVKRRDLDAMEHLVKRCAIVHMQHIAEGGDPFEFGSARPLDFGHWSAHKLESMSGNEVRHGEAVSIGIALDVYCASRMGLLTEAERDRVCNAMAAYQLPLWHPLLAKRSSVSGTLQIVAGLEEFRQHLGGRLTLTMPNGLGRKQEIHDLPSNLVEDAVGWLGARARSTSPAR